LAGCGLFNTRPRCNPFFPSPRPLPLTPPIAPKFPLYPSSPPLLSSLSFSPVFFFCSPTSVQTGTPDRLLIFPPCPSRRPVIPPAPRLSFCFAIAPAPFCGAVGPQPRPPPASVGKSSCRLKGRKQGPPPRDGNFCGPPRPPPKSSGCARRFCPKPFPPVPPPFPRSRSANTTALLVGPSSPQPCLKKKSPLTSLPGLCCSFVPTVGKGFVSPPSVAYSPLFFPIPLAAPLPMFSCVPFPPCGRFGGSSVFFVPLYPFFCSASPPLPPLTSPAVPPMFRQLCPRRGLGGGWTPKHTRPEKPAGPLAGW